MLKRFAVAFLALVILAGRAEAQRPVTLDLRGGAAFPTQDLGDAELKTGAGFELNVLVRVLPHLGVYGGWNWYSFVMDRPFRGTKYDVEDTGYNFGLQFRHPMLSRVDGFVQAGGIYKHLEFENAAGDIIADTGHELGWEVGGGLAIAVTPSLAITPGVRYRTFAADVAIGPVTTPVDMSYVAAEIGLAWTPGARRQSILTARR
jgi:hypothetical protein